MRDEPTSFDPGAAERLDQAINLIIAGAVPLASGDAELDQLSALAARLHHELPNDLPDPAFRSRLRDELAGQVSLAPPTPRRITTFSRHLPVYGSLAAIFIVAIVAGVLAFWPDDAESPTVASGATDRRETAAAAGRSAEPATPTGSGGNMAQVTATVTSVTALLVPTATARATERSTPLPTDTSLKPTTATLEPTQPPAPASATVAQAILPAIDWATVEHGPVPAVDGSGPAPTSGVTYVMAAAPATPGNSATVYHLSAPSDDPVAFCRDLAAKAGIGTDDVRATDAAGRTEVFAGTPGAGSLYWRPDAGVFQYSSDAVAGESELQSDAIAKRALAWLDTIGYPVAALGEPRIDDFGDLWIVSFPYASLPTAAIGFPLGVSLMLQHDGTVAEARGYWLTPDWQESVGLVSVTDAWNSLTHGGGYWLDGGLASSGGEFRADAVTLVSVLTRGGNDLVLQPVYKFSGVFTANDGTTAAISVFSRASLP